MTWGTHYSRYIFEHEFQSSRFIFRTATGGMPDSEIIQNQQDEQEERSILTSGVRALYMDSVAIAVNFAKIH